MPNESQPSAILGDIVHESKQKTVGGKREDWPYIGLEHIESGSPYLLGSAQSGASISTNNVFQKGDVLFGKLRPYLRKSVAAPGDGYCSTDILVLHPNAGIAPSFAAKVFQSEQVFFAASGTSIGTRMPRTSWSLLRQFEVFCPPLPEQRRIAELLDTLDQAIRKTEQVIAKLQQMKQGLLHDLLTRGIDENGELRDPQRHPEQFKDSPLGQIPKGWAVRTLTDLGAQVIDGDRGAAYPNGDDFKPEGYCLFLSAQNVTKSGFKFDDTVFISRSKDQQLRKGRLEFGDIVVTTRGTLGNFAFFDLSVQFPRIRINSGMAIIRVHDASIDPIFLYDFFGSRLCQQQIEAESYGSAQPQLNLSILSNLRLGVPSPNEQQCISKTIAHYRKTVELERSELQKLRTLKRGLMDDLLTGRVRVPIPEEAVV